MYGMNVRSLKNEMESIIKNNNESESTDWGQKMLDNNLLKTRFEYNYLNDDLYGGPLFKRFRCQSAELDEEKKIYYIKIKNKLNELRMRKKALSIYKSIKILKLPTNVLFKISTEMLTLP